MIAPAGRCGGLHPQGVDPVAVPAGAQRKWRRQTSPKDVRPEICVPRLRRLQISTAATPFCSLHLPQAALANVPASVALVPQLCIDIRKARSSPTAIVADGCAQGSPPYCNRFRFRSVRRHDPAQLGVDRWQSRSTASSKLPLMRDGKLALGRERERPQAVI